VAPQYLIHAENPSWISKFDHRLGRTVQVNVTSGRVLLAHENDEGADADSCCSAASDFHSCSLRTCADVTSEA